MIEKDLLGAHDKGLKRMPPEGISPVCFSEYVHGFVTGILGDFPSLTIDQVQGRGRIPTNKATYNAFLAGMAGAVFDSNEYPTAGEKIGAGLSWRLGSRLRALGEGNEETTDEPTIVMPVYRDIIGFEDMNFNRRMAKSSTNF